jgi:hypothetical protein
MSAAGWYERVEGEELHQGDLLWNCPRARLTPAAIAGAEATAIHRVQAVVLTQSCDLVIRANGTAKAEVVLLCPFYTMQQLADAPPFDKKRTWEQCRKGERPQFHVLNRCEVGANPDDFLLVDLGAAFSLDFGMVAATASGIFPRPRLCSPYREHLAQAFARYYMRVGLPSDIPPFA